MRRIIQDSLNEAEQAAMKHERGEISTEDWLKASKKAEDAILAVFTGLPAMQKEAIPASRYSSHEAFEQAVYGPKRNTLRRQILAELGGKE